MRCSETLWIGWNPQLAGGEIPGWDDLQDLADKEGSCVFLVKGGLSISHIR